MSKASKLLFFLLISISGYAQTNDSNLWKRFPHLINQPFKPFQAVNMIQLEGSENLSTKGISNSFIYPFIFRKNLNTETIDENLEKSFDRQLLLEGGANVTYTNLSKSVSKKKPIFWYVKAGTHNRSYARISHDAARLMFKGNTEDERYYFNHNEFSNLRINTLGGGLYYHSGEKKKPFSIQAGAYVLQTLNYAKINTHDGNYLQGNEDSFVLGLNYNAELSNASAFSKSGYGMGLEFQFNQKLNHNSAWGISFSNFGFSQINKTMDSYNSKGEFNFEGVWIPEINRLGESGYFKHQLDSFTDPLINKEENQSKTIWIAPTSSIYFTRQIYKSFYSLIIHHSGTSAHPIFNFRYTTFIKSNVIFSADFSIYSFVSVNSGVIWRIHKKVFLNLGINHIEALVAPNSLGGLGGNGGISILL